MHPREYSGPSGVPYVNGHANGHAHSDPAPADLPHNIEAEQALLGAMLINNQAFGAVQGILRAEHFSDDLHARIYEVAATLIGLGKRADPTTLRSHFEKAPPIKPGLTVPLYLGKLTAFAVTILNAADYAHVIIEAAERREGMAGLYSGFTLLQDPSLPADDTLAQVQSCIGDLQERSARTISRVRSASEFAGQPVPPRVMHVPGMIPSNDITMLGGDGGTGKSLIADQLAVAIVIGRDWLGQKVRRGTAFIISAEDPDDELHRRFHDIATDLGVPLDRLAGLRFLGLAGQDALLGKADESNVVRATPLWHRAARIIAELKPALVVYDTLSDFFAGNENARPQARQFIGMLRGLAIKTGHAALLLSHPSLSGLSSGSGTSGSTAWSNSVRSRLYFERVRGADGSESDPDARVLRTMKANYGPVGGELRVTWRNGVFVPDDGTGADLKNREAEAIFLSLLQTWRAANRKVSPNYSVAYAPKVFAADDRGKTVGKKALEAAMTRLLESARIRIVTIGAPSRQTQILEAAE